MREVRGRRARPMPRVLAREEWAEKLAGTELEPAVPHLPDNSQVLVLEDADGRVIATWALLTYAHVEGAWVHPDYRKRASAVRAMLAAMGQLARERGARCLLTAALTPDIERLIHRLGGQALPGKHFVLPLRG